MKSNAYKIGMAGLIFAVLLIPASALALDGAPYGSFSGLEPRKIVWFLAQMHLFFGAFVLGVPLFAVIIEIAGKKSGDRRLDDLAREFTSLLALAYGATAFFGILLTFALIKLYPAVVGYLGGVFRGVMNLYALLFFAETLFLYLYRYGWDRLKSNEPFSRVTQMAAKVLGGAVLVFALLLLSGLYCRELRTDTRLFLVLCYLLPLSAGLFMARDRKGGHILIGILLNLSGTAIMQAANSWVGFMMSPGGVDEAGHFTGTLLQAFDNRLATPIAIHRMLGNLAFGGLIAGAYGAVRFLGAKTPEEKAHYDWMGYVSNLVAVAALIPLPFAGYYLGREVYSSSAVMGNNMMGGDFSWTFILQALLVGSLFLISNYYLWCGMTRIPGAERYRRQIKFILGALIVSFAVWATPHNLPLSAGEVAAMGGSRFHPTLRYLGLMPAKNAVVNLIMLSTFFSFLLYRRGNRGEIVPVARQGLLPKIILPAAGLLSASIVGLYALHLHRLDLSALGLVLSASDYVKTIAIVLSAGAILFVLSVPLALAGRGMLAEYLCLGYTAAAGVGFFGWFGFRVMEDASPLLRNIAVAQFLLLMGCLILVSVIDYFLFRGAARKGELRWGEMTAQSQYALIFMTILITLTMGLMGFVRSGLRSDWHIYGVMRDVSPSAYTPDNFEMAQMVSLTVLIFLVAAIFLFRPAGRRRDETNGGPK